LLVVEDAHWADSGTLFLLRHLARHTRRQRVLIVATHREVEVDKARPLHKVSLDLHRERLVTQLRLLRLDQEQTRELLAVLFAEEITPEFLEGIFRETEGNPFFIEEVCKALVESGKLYYEHGRWDRPSIEELGIPQSVRVAIQARVGKLPADSQETLRLAAVLGRQFDFDTLVEASELDEDTLTDGLEGAERAQLVEEVSREGGGTFAFVHGLIATTLVEGLRTVRRRRLHRRAAAAIETQRPDDFEALAYHYNQAGEPEKAIDYLLQAGDRAHRLGVSLEAIDFYQLALQKAAELRAPREAIELHRIHESLGDVYLVNLSRHDEALEHYKSFLAMAQLKEDEVRGARKVAGVHLLRGDLGEAQKHYETALAHLSSLPPLAEASRVHYGFACLLILRNRWDEAAQHARASLEISRQIADTRGLADAYRVMSGIAKQQGDLEAACEYDEGCLELYRELGDLPRAAQACNNVGDSCRLLGQMDRALEYLNEGLELARRIGDTRDEAILLQTKAELLLDQGQWEPAIAHLERALPLAEESGAAVRMIEVRWILGSAYERVGQSEDARHHLEMAETLSRDMHHLRFAPRIYLDLARLSAAQGEFGEAENYVQLALDSAGSEPTDAFLGLVHRCYGTLRSRRGDWDDAVRHLEESLRFLERTNLLAEAGKAHLSLGTAYASRGEEGDGGRACEHLLAAQSIFRQIQARGYLARVGVRLKELGCQSDSPDALLGGDAPPTGRAAAKQ
jgi:predicted ATPase